MVNCSRLSLRSVEAPGFRNPSAHSWVLCSMVRVTKAGKVQTNKPNPIPVVTVHFIQADKAL